MGVIIASVRVPSGLWTTRVLVGVSTRTSGCSDAWQRKQASAFLSTDFVCEGGVENMTRPSLL